MEGAEHVSLSSQGCPNRAAVNSALEPSVSDPFPDPAASRRSCLWSCSELLLAAEAESPGPGSRWVRVRDAVCALPSPRRGWGSHCRALGSEHRSEAKGWERDDGAKAEGEDEMQRRDTPHMQEQRIWHRRVLEDSPGVSSALSTYPAISLCKRNTKNKYRIWNLPVRASFLVSLRRNFKNSSSEFKV